MAREVDPQDVFSLIWRSVTLVSLVTLGFWAGHLTAQIETLQEWRKEIEALAQSRDERIKTLERELVADDRNETEFITRLNRIETLLYRTNHSQ